MCSMPLSKYVESKKFKIQQFSLKLVYLAQGMQMECQSANSHTYYNDCVFNSFLHLSLEIHIELYMTTSEIFFHRPD